MLTAFEIFLKEVGDSQKFGGYATWLGISETGKERKLIFCLKSQN